MPADKRGDPSAGAGPPPHSRRCALQCTTPQLEGLRARLEERLRSRFPEVAGVRALGLGLLADFPGDAALAHEDLVAGVTRRFDGGPGGTALLAFDPQDALDWVRAVAPDGPPIDAFVDRAGRCLAAAVEAWVEPTGASPTFRAPALREDSVVGLVLATHAPSNTLLLCARVALEVEGREREADLVLLVDPKVLAGWLAAADA